VLSLGPGGKLMRTIIAGLAGLRVTSQERLL
jgi:hypothetical protein